MPLVNAGRDIIAALLIGESVDPFDATDGRLGVGDSTTAFAASQTDLQAATNKLRKALDGAPSRAGNVLEFVATFGSGDANYDWEEFALFNAAAAGTMLCRKVDDQGTKVSGQVWELTLEVTVVNGDA